MSIAYFDSFASPECDPYALLLHKIWFVNVAIVASTFSGRRSRLVERSPLTVTKAIYIYRRCLLPQTQLISARRMLGHRQSGKSMTAYFDSDVVTEVSKDVMDAANWRAFVTRYWEYVDAAWVTCAEASDALVDEATAIANLAASTSRLISKSTRVLFDKTHKLRKLPDCALINACARQLLQDILILQLLILVCFCLDPASTISSAAETVADLVRRPYIICANDDPEQRMPSIMALLEADEAADEDEVSG